MLPTIEAIESRMLNLHHSPAGFAIGILLRNPRVGNSV